MLRVTSQYAEVLMQLAVPLTVNTTVTTNEDFAYEVESGRIVTNIDLNTTATTAETFSKVKFSTRSLNTTINVTDTIDVVCIRNLNLTTNVTSTGSFFTEVASRSIHLDIDVSVTGAWDIVCVRPRSLATTVITNEVFNVTCIRNLTLNTNVTILSNLEVHGTKTLNFNTSVNTNDIVAVACVRSPSITTNVTTTELVEVFCVRNLALTTTVASLISITYIPGSVIMPSMYGTLIQSDVYFSTRLHSDVWDNSSTSNKTKALYTATRIIDRLNYKGYKNSVYLILEAASSYDDVTQDQRRVAEAAQALEFPRDSDLAVPEDIKMACYEIAQALLDGVDPDIELENLGTTSQSFGGARTSYNRDQQPIEHILHGIPSAYAWRILKPFLRDSRAITTVRIN